MAIKPVRKAVFPVAGLGTRFLPATKAMPKEMLTVVDKPLIQYAVEEARAAGIEWFSLGTGRGKTALVEHFDVAYELEATLRGAVTRRPGVDVMTGHRLLALRDDGEQVRLEVEVVDGGYQWEGVVHASLSSIAKAVTGAHWSGPRLFELTSTARG